MTKCAALCLMVFVLKSISIIFAIKIHSHTDSDNFKSLSSDLDLKKLNENRSFNSTVEITVNELIKMNNNFLFKNSENKTNAENQEIIIKINDTNNTQTITPNNSDKNNFTYKYEECEIKESDALLVSKDKNETKSILLVMNSTDISIFLIGKNKKDRQLYSKFGLNNNTDIRKNMDGKDSCCFEIFNSTTLNSTSVGENIKNKICGVSCLNSLGSLDNKNNLWSDNWITDFNLFKNECKLKNKNKEIEIEKDKFMRVNKAKLIIC